MLSKKVIITGSFGVGKTSLLNKFIYSKFDEKYHTTIGVKVDKKELNIDGTPLTLMLWDVAGEISQDKVPKPYFLGTSGIIYVFDLTRKATMENISSDLAFIQNLNPGIKIKIVGNKKDLVDNQTIQRIQQTLEAPFNFLVSAKTGENVEKLFTELGTELIEDV